MSISPKSTGNSRSPRSASRFVCVKLKVAGSPLRVIAYRPDYIGPTREEAHLGQDLLYWFFAPVGVAVKATQIGEAMLEVTARGSQFENGARLSTLGIVRHSDAWRRRVRP